ncbi:ATP-dependent dethiobiotin synthetase BioD [Wenyingzhuangia fucanilytica]|uniref:ATP-dependent dethiobiotin synthetase BioD n=1 Tax=Wenyingzhuangia fucanilytica TaxID=1790137 RepID=A0A1B1Y294_9FLAO|nr:dethiobiotin synthase [Wenyingzhuangia fucanilytica]ANW94893.1 ATP-dependent dethiobiotin synthetase BioD [Wenyingzhuangia fucanilytica]
MSKSIFVTGISTEVGKTLVSAILVEALNADYWKPVQAGELSFSDADKVKSLISNQISTFHPITYALNTPMSPHAAADIDGITIELDKIITPKTENNLVIEGAGGILVPINHQELIIDIIPKEALVVVVSRHYLGSINHTLMTVELLKQKGFNVVIVFSGNEHKTTEDIIKKMTGVKVIGRVEEEAVIDKSVVKKYADLFKENLENELK